MTQETWTVGQIEVRVSGFFTTHHFFETEVGTLGELTIPAFGRRAVFRAPDGRELQIQQVGRLRSRYELLEGEMVKGTAAGRGVLSRDWAIEFHGQTYTMKPKGFLKEGWFLIDDGGNTVLEIRMRGVLRQSALLTITGAVDADLAVLAYYLVHVRQQEAGAAAAAAS